MHKTKQIEKESFDFLAMIAHDLKTPIKAQIRAMNLLYSGIYGEVSDEAKNLMLNIIASNKYLKCLADNVLGDYRINNGKFFLTKTTNDFRKTLEEAVCNIGILSEVKGQKIVINYFSENFTKTYDEIEIQRVLINLLSNAFEYGRENSDIVINVDANLNELRFEIISEPDKSIKLNNFEYKNKSSMNCGLGLVICSKIIALHKGIFKSEITENGCYKASFILT